MTDVLGPLDAGPNWGVMTDRDVLERARDLPVGYGEMFRSTVAESFITSPGIGTAVREADIPDGVPSRDVTTPPELEIRDPLAQPRAGADQPFRVQPPPGTWLETEEEYQTRRKRAGALSKEEWEASPHFRTGIPYDPGMTQDRASALAAWYDASKVRQDTIARGPGGVLGNALWLGGMVLGGAPDPVNYISIFGPEVRAAQIARFGRLGGAALTSAADAMLNTAAASALTAGMRSNFGDEVTWQGFLTDVAVSAVIGGAFGAATSRWEGWQTARAAHELERVVEARRALNDALHDVVQDRPVEVTPAVADAVEKTATRTEPPRIKTPEGASVDETVWGSTKGQTDITLTAKNSAGEVVGRLDYAEFDGVPNINMIEVAKGARRQGFGALLIRELQAKYPEQEINWGMLTEDGARLREAIPTRVVEDADVKAMAAELDVLKSRYAEMEQRANRFAELDNPTADDIAKVQAETSGMNDLFDRIRDIEAEIGDRPAAKRFVITEPPSRMAVATPQPDAPDPVAIAASAKVGQPAKNASDEFGIALKTTKIAEPTPEPPAKKTVKAIRGEDGRISGLEVEGPSQAADLAKQQGISIKTGDFPEMAEFEQLVALGRVTPDELAAVKQATELEIQSDAYAKALEAAAICRVGM